MSFIDALEQGAKSSITVAAACVCRYSCRCCDFNWTWSWIANMIVQLAGGNLFLTLLFTMIASIILRWPPYYCKVHCFSYNGSACINNFKCHLMAAHLFLLYFGVVADIAPPVALAAYAGAGIAGANSIKQDFKQLNLLLQLRSAYIFAFNPFIIN